MSNLSWISVDAPLHECLRAHARQTPDKVAYLWYGAAITFAALDRASDAFAARLAALGVRKGEPVALFMNNCPQYVIAHYGIQKLGAIVCPCGPLNKEHELEYQLTDLQARIIVAADNLLPVVDKVRGKTALQHVFVVRYADLLPEQPMLDVPPDSIGMFTPINMPAMWYSGAMASSTSLFAMPLVLTDTSVLYRALRKVSMAPLGKPVVPEV